ncbi:MAG: hypothetical protein ACWA44_09475 [Thiotrichales bacterium]
MVILIVLLGSSFAAYAGNQQEVAVKQDQVESIALVEARYASDNIQGSGARESVGSSLSLPTGLWIMGSLLLAMAGYKRMRNKTDPS